MATELYGGLDLLSEELLNAKAHNRAFSGTGLDAGDAGLIGYQGGRFRVWDGTQWILVGDDSDLLQGENGAYYLNLANSSGDLDASRVAGLKAAVVLYRLDEFAAATSPISVPAGTLSGHAVNRSQLDAVQAIAEAASSGTAIKSAVRAVSTTNITLSGTQTVDSVALVDGERVLVAGQTDPAENGIYVVAAGAWARAEDADESGELAPGTQVVVTGGTSAASAGGNADSIWRIVSDAAITVGTTAQTWERLPGSAPVTYSAGDGISVAGNEISVVAGDGIAVDGSGVAVDASVLRVARGTVPAGASPVTVTHSLDVNDLASFQVYRASDSKPVGTDWVPTGANTVSVNFGSVSPGANEFRFVAAG